VYDDILCSDLSDPKALVALGLFACFIMNIKLISIVYEMSQVGTCAYKPGLA
jgi:hypothetical protein